MMWYDYVPRLKSYEEALSHYNNVKPVRGDKEKRRPLGRRSHKWMHITKVGDDICIMSGGSNHVTYKPDNIIQIRDMSHRDSSAARLIQSLFYARCKVQHGTVWIACKAKVGEEVKEGFLPLRTVPWNESGKSKNVDVFRLEGGCLFSLNPNFPVQHVLDKKKFNEAKKQYKSFYRYLVANCKLRGADGYSQEEKQKTSLVDTDYVPTAGKGWRQEAVVIEAAASDDTEKHYALFLEMVPNEVVRQYYWNTPTAARNIKLMKEQFTKFVLHNHHKEVISKQTVHSMKITKDEYEWVARLPT